MPEFIDTNKLDEKTSQVAYGDGANNTTKGPKRKRIERSTTNSSRKDQGQRIGRNEKCPCGSGKKFKHCHGAAPTRSQINSELRMVQDVKRFVSDPPHDQGQTGASVGYGAQCTELKEHKARLEQLEKRVKVMEGVK